MNYYQHHIGDFIKATACLTDANAMRYLRLIWMYYNDERPLLDDPEVLALKVGGTTEEIRLLLRAFFKLENGVWHHARCDAELDDYRKFCDGQKEKAKKGGRPKKEKTVSAETPTGNPPETLRDTSGNPPGTQRAAGESPGEPTGNPTHYPLTNISTTNVVDVGESKKRAARKAPIDWFPSQELKDWARVECPQVQAMRETAKFKDHTFKNPITDWNGAWRNWMRRAQDQAGYNRPTGAEHKNAAAAKAIFEGVFDE